MNFKLWLEDNPYTKERKTWPSYTSDPERLASLPDDKLWFHGSPNKFDQFKIAGMKRRVSHWNNFLGTHFTADPQVAYDIATYDADSKDPAKGYTYDVELDVNNPLDVGKESNMDVEALKLAYDQGLVTEKDIKSVMAKGKYIEHGGSWSDKQMTIDQFFKDHSSIGRRSRAIINNLGPKRAAIAKNYKKNLQSKGHDGIVYKSDYRGEGHAPCIVVFDPSKIKINKAQEV